MRRDTTEQALDTDLRELIMLSRRGNQAAYKKFLSQIVPLVRRTVCARLRQLSQQGYAEDITQEALLAIHLKLHTYDADQAFLPWLRTVARYKMIDFLRRNKHSPTLSLEDEDVPEPEDSRSQQDITASRDLEKLLAQLKPPAGEIIRSLKVEGSSIRELAVNYKISEANIKVIVHRGLQKLSKLVQTEGMVVL